MAASSCGAKQYRGQRCRSLRARNPGKGCARCPVRGELAEADELDGFPAVLRIVCAVTAARSNRGRFALASPKRRAERAATSIAPWIASSRTCATNRASSMSSVVGEWPMDRFLRPRPRASAANGGCAGDRSRPESGKARWR